MLPKCLVMPSVGSSSDVASHICSVELCSVDASRCVSGSSGIPLRKYLRSARPRFNPMPGKLVDVNGHKMHIVCSGEGMPTVILDSGLGDTYISWRKCNRRSRSSLECAPTIAPDSASAIPSFRSAHQSGDRGGAARLCCARPASRRLMFLSATRWPDTMSAFTPVSTERGCRHRAGRRFASRSGKSVSAETQKYGR